LSIAVIIPTFNRANFIAKAIASVQRQECELPIQIIVIDDGSTDDTKKILQEISKDDRRVSIFTQQNQGVSSARNTGIKAISNDTKYITFLDSDDVMIKDRLHNQIPILEMNSQIEYVIGKISIVNHLDIEELEPKVVYQDATVMTHSTSGAIFRRSVFEKIGLFNENLKAAEDLDLFLRLAEARVPFEEIDQACIYYIKHQSHHITEDKPCVAKSSAKAIALSIVRRRNSPRKLLMPNFNTESLKKLMLGER